jgi:hypothetical protein
MRVMSKDIQFEAWLTSVLPHSAPPEIVAYNFDLAEAGDWIVEVIGASAYDKNDDDWACPPATWTSQPSRFYIPRKTAPTWELALAYVRVQVGLYINDNKSVQSGVLREAEVVCAGFVDGQLTLIWSRSTGSEQS